MNSRIKIGQAAKTLGVSIDTLRRWEKVGKLVPEKTAGGTRYYNLASLQTQFVDSVKTSPTISKSNKLVRLRSLQVTGSLRKSEIMKWKNIFYILRHCIQRNGNLFPILI